MRVVLVQVASLQEIFKGAAAGILVQLLLGLPFLLHNAGSYLSRAFELSRVFLHVWSVNLKFLPEPVFQSKVLAVLLLAAHLLLLWLFAQYRCGVH
jgi:alpha-1,3-mannosyltransferase